MKGDIFFLDLELPASGSMSRFLALAGIPVPKRLRIVTAEDETTPGKTEITLADEDREVILARVKVTKA